LKRFSRELEYLSGRSFFLRPESLYRDRLEQLSTTKRRLDLGIANTLARKRQSLNVMAAKLNTMNPENVLTRGYAIVCDLDGNPIKDPATVKVGQLIRAKVKGGIIESQVTDTKEEHPDE